MMNFKYRSNLFGVGVLRNNFIYEVTEDVIKYLVPAGIPQYFSRFIEKVVFHWAPPVEEKAAEVFNFEDLKFSFMILVFSLAFSSFVFVMEILIFNVREFVGLKAFKKFFAEIPFQRV
jgi:hypothetical protein